MALGTVTRASTASDYTVANKRFRRRIVQLTSGANYTTGGSTITPSAVGLSKTINSCLTEGNAVSTDGTTARSIGFIHQTDGSVKLLVYTTASAEAANNSDQSGFTTRIIFVGV